MSPPPFLHGYVYVVQFRTLACSATVFSPHDRLATAEVILMAAELVRERCGAKVQPGEKARIHGPHPMAGGPVVTVTAEHLREPDEEDEDEDW